MKKICSLVLIGLCMTVVSFAQEKPAKNTPPPPPPPPEIVKDIKIETVEEVTPPPPPPPAPRAPKKPLVQHKNKNNIELSRDVKEQITGTTIEIDTIQPPPPPPKKPKHVVHHKIKKVVVQPKDPGKTTKQNSPQQVSN
jgi:hypothetical protein